MKGVEELSTVAVDQIARMPLFAGLPKPQLDALAALVLKRTCKRGHLIFSDGDEGTGFYIVLSGRVKIFKVSPEGKEHILHIFGAGESFGEVSVFTGQGYPACAEAYEDGSLLFFPKDAFLELTRKDPSLALNMLALLSLRLRKFAALVEDLSLKEVPGRLAAYLLYLSRDSDKIELDITKGELASLLGTIPETLSRILTRMIRQELINTNGSHIRILDRKALEEIAGEGKKLP
jgi:CRP/FNR family transcriptional regulator